MPPVSRAAKISVKNNEDAEALQQIINDGPTLSECDDQQLFDELKRRGYSGSLRLTKVINV